MIKTAKELRDSGLGTAEVRSNLDASGWTLLHTEVVRYCHDDGSPVGYQWWRNPSAEIVHTRLTCVGVIAASAVAVLQL